MAAASLEAARAAKRRLVARLPRSACINGVGIQPVRGGFVLSVNLVEETPDLKLPKTVNGVDVRVRVVGAGFPQSSDIVRPELAR